MPRGCYLLLNIVLLWEETLLRELENRQTSKRDKLRDVQDYQTDIAIPPDLT